MHNNTHWKNAKRKQIKHINTIFTNKSITVFFNDIRQTKNSYAASECVSSKVGHNVKVVYENILIKCQKKKKIV